MESLVRRDRARLFLLLALLPAAPGLAGSEVPPGGRVLPACEELAVTLSNADLRLLVRPGATPYLTARAVIPGRGVDESVPADPSPVEVRAQGRKLGITRAAAAGDARLRVEVVLGSVRTAVALSLESSDAELSGVAGGVLAGKASFFRTRESSGELTVRLEGGGAEIEGHRGKLVLSGRKSEIELRDAGQEIDFQLDGGRLAISEARGRLGGAARRGAVLLLSEWSGEADLEADGSALELRNFRPGLQALRVKAKDAEVTVEALPEAVLELEQTGGELRLRDVNQLAGKITTNLQARVEITRVGGAWSGVFQDSEVRADAVEHLAAELYNAVLELEGARGLELIANGSQVTATALEGTSHVNVVTSRAELELAEGSRAEVTVQGLSEAVVRLRRPCFVLVDDMETEGGPALDVAGCTVGEAPGGAEEDASVLSGAVGGGSRLTVREAF